MRSFLLVALVLLIAVAPMVSATEIIGETFINETMNATGSNTSINFTGMSVYADKVQIESTYITFLNATISNACGNLTSSTLNFTALNNVTFSASFPLISACSGNTVTISNGLNFSVNTTFNVSTNGIVPSSPSLTYSNGSSQNPTYSYDSIGGTISVNVSSLPLGVSTLTLSNVCGDSFITGVEACDEGVYTGVCPSTCSATCQRTERNCAQQFSATFSQGLVNAVMFFGIIGLLLVIFAILAFSKGNKEQGEEKIKLIGVLIIILLIAALLAFIIFQISA